MKVHRTVIAPGLALVAIALLTALPGPAASQPVTAATVETAEDTASRQERINARVQARLNRMAERLQIDASQQAAWTAYAQTVQGMIPTERSKPPADADAATLMQYRAQRAAEYAQKLTQLADATAALQQALTPAQRQTLNEMMRHQKRGKHDGGRGHHRTG